MTATFYPLASFSFFSVHLLGLKTKYPRYDTMKFFFFYHGVSARLRIFVYFFYFLFFIFFLFFNPLHHLIPPSLIHHSKDIVVAGGLHKAIATEYFRIGHMGITVTDSSRGDLDKVLKGVEDVLKAAKAKGAKSEDGQ
jgi:hypothetical protein